MKPCVFCEIVAGQVPAHVVVDLPECLCFLDTRPLFHGHVLCVPRKHVETLIELEVDEIGPLFRVVQRVTRAVTSALACEGTFVAMNNKVSQSVPHLHVHVVPRNQKDGLRGFFWPRTKYDGDAQMADVASRIREAAL
jgi:histidine triad (HIT) family protein